MGITGLDMAAAHATTELPKDTKVTIYIKNTTDGVSSNAFGEYFIE